jgi:hypothetical protein
MGDKPTLSLDQALNQAVDINFLSHFAAPPFI